MTAWTLAHQTPLPVELSRQEYWSWLPLPSPGDLPNPVIEPRSLALQADSLPSEPWGSPSEFKEWLNAAHTGLCRLSLLPESRLRCLLSIQSRPSNVSCGSKGSSVFTLSYGSSWVIWQSGVAIVSCRYCLRKESLLHSSHLIHLVDDESLWPPEMAALGWLHAGCGRLIYVGWRWREVLGLLVVFRCDPPTSTFTALHPVHQLPWCLSIRKRHLKTSPMRKERPYC